MDGAFIDQICRASSILFLLYDNKGTLQRCRYLMINACRKSAVFLYNTQRCNAQCTCNYWQNVSFTSIYFNIVPHFDCEMHPYMHEELRKSNYFFCHSEEFVYFCCCIEQKKMVALKKKLDALF